MKTTANKRLIPINTEEAKTLAAKIAKDVVALKDEWINDPEIQEEVREETNYDSLGDLIAIEAARYIGYRLDEFDIDIVPNVGVMPQYGTTDYYRWMAQLRWKKPIHVEVWLAKRRGKGTRDKHEQSSSGYPFGSYSKRTSRLALYIPKFMRISEMTTHSLTNAFYMTLVHELTHAMDPDVRNKDKKYGQRDHEVRATARQVTEEVSEFAPIAKALDPKANSSEIFWRSIGVSKQWRRANRKHDEMGQRKILEYVYTELVDRGLL